MALHGALQGQGQQRKVLKWPNNAALVGWVGLAMIGEETTEEWVSGFIGRHLTVGDSGELARALMDELQAAIPAADRNEALTLHLAAFEQGTETPAIPRCWYITNNTPSEPIRPWSFSDEFPQYVEGFPESQWQSELHRRAQALDPAWFHQGIDLQVFNTLGIGVKLAFRTLVQDGVITFPQSLQEWERFARFQVLMFASYFEAFKPPYDRLVGGGADVASLPWALPNR